MIGLGSGLTVSVEPSVASDLQSASTTKEKLAIIGAAAGCGAVALARADGMQLGGMKPFGDSDSMKPFGDGDCLKPFGDGECVKPFGDGN